MVAKKEHKLNSGCPIANALDIFGDHWTLLIIRNLMFLGHHEYRDMLEAEEQIATNILSARLKNLEADGIIKSKIHPKSRRRKLYYLTAKGKDLVDVMVEIVLWADKHLSDQLKIPPDKKALLEADPEKFKALTLENLAAWEKENLR